MSTTIADQPATGRRSGRLALLAGLALVALAAMTWVWGSFYALRHQQSYRVLFSAGDFAAEPPGAAAEGTRLSTGGDGYASVQLDDGSVIKLMPDTALDIEVARARADGAKFVTGLRLLSGEIDAEVSRGDGRAREVNLFSDSIAIGVRGTAFAVQEQGGLARVMVTRGQVEARGEVGDAVPVDAGSGAVVKAGEAMGEVTALPRPPVVAGTAKATREGMAVRWTSAPARPGYLVEIAEDREFRRLLRRHAVDWQTGTLPPMSRDGDFFWRVAGVDERGLRGGFSAAQPLRHDFHQSLARTALEELDPVAMMGHLARSPFRLDAEVADLRARGFSLLEQGDVAAARPVLEALQGLLPDDSEVANALARADYELLDYAAARNRFKSSALGARENNIADADAQVGMALIDVRQGKFQEGLDRTAKVLAEAPQHLGALQVAAMASVGLGQRDAALAFVRRALAVNPDDLTAQALSRTLEAPAASPPAPPVRPES